MNSHRSNNGGQQQQQAQQFLSHIQRDMQQMQSTITSANNIHTCNSLPICSTSAATMITANNQQGIVFHCKTKQKKNTKTKTKTTKMISVDVKLCVCV